MGITHKLAVSLGRIDQGGGLGPFAGVSDAGTGLGYVSKVVSSIIGIMTICASIWFMFQLLVAGVAWLSSGGDKTKLSEARDRMTNAFIGLIIVVAAWAIIAIVGQFLGFDILLKNPGTIINNLNM